MKGKKATTLLVAMLMATFMSVAAEELQLTTPTMRPVLDYNPSLIPRGGRKASPRGGLEGVKVWRGFLTPQVNYSKALRVEKPYYKPLDDLTFVGVPLFVAGIIAKGEKKSFRQDYDNVHSNTRLVTNFKTSIDDYSQYFGPVMAVGLKLGGVEGRSDWGRFLVSGVLGYATMAALVNSIKYTAKEMRPDGSTANSWPSGHTATSFVGATILHKEYGLTHSPWYSVAGYGVATATGIMRVLNNRHWVSDVLSGAGIGIMAGELGYTFGDLLFKGKGLRRGELNDLTDINHPSFFSVSMGVGLNNPTLSFEYVEDEEEGRATHYDLDFQTATSVAVEGAYFINKYIGVGGRLRVKSTPVKGWSNLLSQAEVSLTQTMKEMEALDDVMDHGKVMQNLVTEPQFTIESDHLTEFAGDVGLYFNLPLSSRFAIGTKALIGRSIMQELDLNAQFKGHRIDMPYDATVRNGEIVDFNIIDFIDTGEEYSCEWDYATLGGTNSTKYGTGLSVTYAYKNNFRWTVFADFDYTKKDFTLTVDENAYAQEAIPNLVSLTDLMGGGMGPKKQTVSKSLRQWTIGASFTVAF